MPHFSKKAIAAVIALGPLAAFAGSPTVATLISRFSSDILTPLIELSLLLALFAFLWGMVKYISKVDSDAERKKGRDMMVGGVVALFVMTSVWGLVNLIKNTLNLDNTPVETITLPTSGGNGN